ncbi:LysR family transcriptional regulator [Aliikangiella coralliicola]|uniref:LysR family transcriptional regulator n=1 Tax=Aliikangiella coralliicola TaxID=2592383 RepID=A0A545UHA1_9GAMM|nr:LysR family transcriptional regulator [Aliikangiella coralliicola]TQV88839.1 LysR family transcriptional regulator [Aliikangiella coralliicola]
MDKLRAMELFVRLAEVGSFTRLAEERNLSKSMISKEISRLEEDIGARLLHRSTRNIQLTQVGSGYLERCREILMKLDDADSYVQDHQHQPKGKLRINAPMALGLTDLSLLFAAFMREYPDIELDIHLSDEPLDLVKQGFDVGFRASSTRFDSSYVGKPLTQFSYHVCVAADYFESNPNINQPDDLIQHNCLVYSYFRGKNYWPLGDGVEVSGRLKVNSTPFMMELIRQGLGVGFIPDFVCDYDLKKGTVVEVLANVNKPKLTLYALYPARQFAPPKLSHCIGFFERWFQQQEKKSSLLF